MLFNSFIFIVFALIFFLLWSFLKKYNYTRWVFLCFASFVFYAWWDWRFLFLIIFSGLVDYVAGLLMKSHSRKKRVWLVVSLVMNLGSLSIFKYSSFIANSLDSLMSGLGVEVNLYDNIPESVLILPVGISFYTFQSMSYTIDIYKQKLKPVGNIFHFFAYLSMFPQLVAGPIIRARDLLSQLSKDRKVTLIGFWHGGKLIVIGLFQKTVLADNIGVLVNDVYNSSGTYSSGIFWWVVSIGFALQIYFDFTGYSLIARGLAKWMGYHFRMNFNHPYLAKSLKQFWQGWHISLSTWFRDYVYIPLGGSKKSSHLSHVFMWVTMVISGLWHGAAFTFIIWGLIHAFFLSFERLFSKRLQKLPSIILYFFTMFQVLIAWVFFRAATISDAFNVLKKMFDFSEVNMYWLEFENAYYFLIAAITFEFLYFLSLKYKAIKGISNNSLFQCVELAMLITFCLFFRGPEQAFIYFQF